MINGSEPGWLAPIVVDEEGIVLAGHGRLRAAQLLHMETVPTIQVKHLTPERKRAFMLADNRLARLNSQLALYQALGGDAEPTPAP